MEYVAIIDAGHGPNTAGKRSPDGSLREYQFNHPTAQKLASKLRAVPGVRVYFSYTPGVDTPLAERVKRANAVYAKYASAVKNGRAKVVFISIHANAMGAGGWNSAAGIETFAHAPASANPSSTKLAKEVQADLVAITGRPNRGVKHMAFYVLKNTHMPAILIEAGFMTNKTEAALLKSAAYREKIAQGAYTGTLSYFGLKAPGTTQKPAAPTPKPAEAKPAATIPPKEALNMSQTPSERFSKAVDWAKENAISDGSNPHLPPTREQLLQILFNYDAHQEAKITAIVEREIAALMPDPDAEPYPAHAEAVKWAIEQGVSDGSRPQVDAMRQHVMAMIYNDNKRKGTL